MKTIPLARAFVLSAFAICLATPAAAAPVRWNVPFGSSRIEIHVFDRPISGLGTVQFREQTGAGISWNAGSIAHLSGTFQTNFESGTSIEFLSAGSNLDLIDTGNYRPNPAAFDPASVNASNPDGQFTNTSSASAVFGAKIRGVNGPIAADVAYYSVRDVSLLLTSSVIPVGNDNTFSLSGLSLSATGLGSYDGLVAPFIGQLLPDFADLPQTVFSGSVLSPAQGRIFRDRDVDIMQLNFIMELPLLSGTGFDVNGTVSGQIFAYSTVPEPSSFALTLFGGSGVAAAQVTRRRRRNRFQPINGNGETCPPDRTLTKT
jgi:hypothetical protein